MLTATSAPLFAGRKRQQAEQGGRLTSQKPRRDEEILDTIIVNASPSPESDVFRSRSSSPDSQVDDEPHLRATLPDVGDLFQSRSAGNLRHQARLLSKEELKLDFKQHTAFKTYTALDLLLDVAHPLEPDKKSKNPSKDRYCALRDLRALVKKPSRPLSESSERYLKSVGIINRHNEINEATCYDVKKLLEVSPKGQNISLKLPDRAEARTYWQRPLN